MNVGSVVRPRLVEVAIQLFGDKGYDGVSVADLAVAANTTGATVYRLFSHRKSKLYSVAVREAVARAHEAVDECEFLFDDTGADLAGRIGQALRLWDRKLGVKEARLLQQVLIADSKHRKLARAPLNKMAGHLSKALEKSFIANKGREFLYEAASTQIDALLQLKIAEQADEGSVKKRINVFLELVFPK